MIGKLKGTVDSIRPSEALIDVNGVGYCVSIPFSTYSAILGESSVSLFVHTHVREDQIRLFGFYTEDEKKLFEMLIQISGIGPSVALSVISGIDPPKLYEAVQSGETNSLTVIPGIGKSKAEKLVFELKRKWKKPLGTGSVSGNGEIKADAVDALISLGFDERSALKTIESILKDDGTASLESLVRKALRSLSA
ncbi:MAG: Holliday junction branch migration protein RuvA [Spirochaetota bacterium]